MLKGSPEASDTDDQTPTVASPPTEIPTVNEAVAKSFLSEVRYIVDSLYRLSTPLEGRVDEVLERRTRTILLLNSLEETSNPFTNLLEHRYPLADPDIIRLCSKSLMEDHKQRTTLGEDLPGIPSFLASKDARFDDGVYEPGASAPTSAVQSQAKAPSFKDSGIGSSYNSQIVNILTSVHPSHGQNDDTCTITSTASDTTKLTFMSPVGEDGEGPLLPPLPKSTLRDGGFLCPICGRALSPMNKSKWK